MGDEIRHIEGKRYIPRVHFKPGEYLAEALRNGWAVQTTTGPAFLRYGGSGLQIIDA